MCHTGIRKGFCMASTITTSSTIPSFLARPMLRKLSSVVASFRDSLRLAKTPIFKDSIAMQMRMTGMKPELFGWHFQEAINKTCPSLRDHPQIRSVTFQQTIRLLGFAFPLGYFANKWRNDPAVNALTERLIQAVARHCKCRAEVSLTMFRQMSTAVAEAYAAFPGRHHLPVSAWMQELLHGTARKHPELCQALTGLHMGMLGMFDEPGSADKQMIARLTLIRHYQEWALQKDSWVDMD